MHLHNLNEHRKPLPLHVCWVEWSRDRWRHAAVWRHINDV